MLHWVVRLPRRSVMFFIRVYQKTLSFDHGPLKFLYPLGYCRFHPSCSEYGYRCIKRFGVIRGGWLAVKRVVRCNPFSDGGNDPVPKKDS